MRRMNASSLNVQLVIHLITSHSSPLLILFFCSLDDECFMELEATKLFRQASEMQKRISYQLSNWFIIATVTQNYFIMDQKYRSQWKFTS